MSTRVLLLTQWFEPEPTLKGLAFARALVDQGLHVEVVTGFPNYPGGRLYPGYRVRPWQRETMQGVHVTRVPLYPSHDGSAVRRVLNYLSFGVSATLFGLLRWRKPDVIYVYHPPLTVTVAAMIVGFLRRAPVVIDIQDMWPDTLRATGMLSSERALSAVGSVCRWVYRRAAHIVVLSEGFRRLLLERGVPAGKVTVIPNWCDEAAICSAANPTTAGLPGPDHFVVLFAGNMGRAQALDAVLGAAALACDEEPRLNFVFIGGGIEVERLKASAAVRQLPNVRFLPAVPMSEVAGVLRAADVLLVHLKRDELFAITIPSKTQAYMAAGRPVLMAVGGDAAALVQLADCGRVAVSEDPRSIADAAIELARTPPEALNKMGLRGQAYYNRYLSLAVGARRFAELFRQIEARCKGS